MRLLAVAALVAVGASAVRRQRARQAEADLWAEATAPLAPDLR